VFGDRIDRATYMQIMRVLRESLHSEAKTAPKNCALHRSNR